MSHDNQPFLPGQLDFRDQIPHTYKVKCSAFENETVLTADSYNKSAIFQEVGDCVRQLTRSGLDGTVTVVGENDTKYTQPFIEIKIIVNQPLV